MSCGLLARSRAAIVCACAGLAAAGCATATNSTVTVTGKTLAIYAGEPPGGAGGQGARDVIAAEQLALQQAGNQAGKFRIKFATLHAAEPSADARSAIEDQSTIAYLGELIPGTSWASAEITNEEDLLQVSPTDTASFLTQATPAVKGAPGRFYPSSKSYGETFARVVPNTAQEASAQATEIGALHVKKLYVADDGQWYGDTIAGEVQVDAGPLMTVVTGPATATSVKKSGADALFLGTGSETTATRVFDAVAAVSPNAKLFGPSALYDDAFASSLAAAAQRDLILSSPGFMPKDLPPAGVKFVSDFTAAYGHSPAPEAIFGYEALAAVLAVIRDAGSLGANRGDVVSGFRSLRNRASVLGTYSIVHGDTNLAPFVFGRVQAGQLIPFKFLQAQA